MNWMNWLPWRFVIRHLGPNDYCYWDDFWGIAAARRPDVVALPGLDVGRGRTHGLDQAQLIGFVSPDIEVTGIEVPDSELARVASDHLPLVADLRIPRA